MRNIHQLVWAMLLGFGYLFLFIATQPIPPRLPPDTNCPATLMAGERYLLKLGERICTEIGSLILDNQSRSPVPVTEDFRGWMRSLETVEKGEDAVLLVFEEPDTFHPIGRSPDFYQHATVFYPPKNEWANFWVWTAMYFQLATYDYPQLPRDERLLMAESTAFAISCALKGMSYEEYKERAVVFMVTTEELYNFTLRKVKGMRPPVLWPKLGESA